MEEAPKGRKTRAASKAATTTRARNTRSNKTKKKNKSAEPVFNLAEDAKQENEEIMKTPESRTQTLSVPKTPSENAYKTPDNCAKLVKTPDTVRQVHKEEWLQPANLGVIAPYNRLNPQTPVSQKNCKTPIQNFSSMNVKEKAQAYEEIVLISPMSNSKSKTSNVLMTPQQSPVTPKTPVTVTRKSISPKTPELSGSAKVPTDKIQSQKKGSISQTVETPETKHRSSQPKRVSRSSRKSLRVSLKRVSLKCAKLLPSEAKKVEVRYSGSSRFYCLCNVKFY